MSYNTDTRDRKSGRRLRSNAFLDEEDLAMVYGCGLPTAPSRENWSKRPVEGGLYMAVCNGNTMYGPATEAAVDAYIMQVASQVVA